MTDNNATAVDAPLPVNLQYIPAELKITAKSELSEDENTIEEKLKLFRSLLKEEEDLRYQDDDMFLLSFLRVKKYDVRKALSTIKSFYSTMGKHGHIYYTLDFDYMKKIMSENSCCILPYRDKDSSIIVVFRFTYWDHNNISVEQHLICISLGLMQALRSPATQIAGIKIIADFKDFSMAHLLCVTPSSMTFFIKMMQNVIPVRIRGIHVVNQNYLFSCMWSVCKYIAPKKVTERTHFHGNDLESLHKFISPNILPTEYGGTRPKMDNTEWCEIMERSSNYTQHVLSFGYEKYLKKYKNFPSNSTVSLQ